MGFNHLHVHSEYSLLDGMSSIETLVKRAKELGQQAIAITDHGSTSGLWQLQQIAQKEGIKPILGTEFYYVRENDGGNGHLVVLAKNNEGLKNIHKMQEKAYVSNFYYKPRITFDMLKEHSEGIIVLSACLASTLCQHLIKNEYNEAKEWAIKFKTLLGEDFYLEIQPNQIVEQWEVNKKTIQIGKELDIKVVATNDVHYAMCKDSFTHEVMLAMQSKKKMSDPKRFKFDTEDFWLRSREEMIEAFNLVDMTSIEIALDNTQDVADKCNAVIQIGSYLPPYHNLKEGYTPRKQLVEEVLRGAKTKGKIRNKKYMEDVQNEINVIDEEGYCNYFLTVQDYVTSARNRNETVGDGRGSASGSKVSYLLDITRIDPNEHNLLFERFLAKGRIPDIDQDFSNQEAVFKDLQAKYGEDSVAHIATYGRLTLKAVVRAVLGVFELDSATINFICKMIPDNASTVKEALEISNEFAEVKDEYRVEFEIIEKLEGRIRQEGTHAGGVVIYPNLSDYLPLRTDSEDRNARIVCYDMDMVHDIGFHKFDILGLTTISVVKDAKDSIKKATDKDIDLYEIDYNDKQIYDMLCKGDVSGVFQLANQATKVLEQQPKNFDDLIAINALIRPGIGDWTSYLSRRAGEEYYLNPLRESYMKDTEGIITYQEQFLLDCHYFAGWGIAYADNKVRKNKNIRGDVELKDKFITDSTKRGHSKDEMLELWEDIQTSVDGGYSFNKSHSASYAMLSFQTAWLKYYYPEHFYASTMSFEKPDGDGQKNVSVYIAECKQKGIKIVPPDINNSTEKFVVTDDGIAYRITVIKDVGESAIKYINKARPFSSFDDFLERAEKKYAKVNVVTNLIKSGSFDVFDKDRGKLLKQFYELRRKKCDFDYDDKLKLEWEKESLGLYLSSHPMERYSFKALAEYTEGERALQGGEVKEVIIVKDKKQRDMAFIDLDTQFGIVRVVAFWNKWNDKVKEMFKVGSLVLVRGTRSGNSILYDSMEVLE